MELYTAFDLHSSNNYLAIIDKNRKRVFKKKLPNNPKQILTTLKPYRHDIVGIVVESTYSWYWLVDLLMAEGYKVHLANPAEIQKYSGLKYADDGFEPTTEQRVANFAYFMTLLYIPVVFGAFSGNKLTSNKE